MSTAITKSIKEKVKLVNKAHKAAEKHLNEYLTYAIRTGELLLEIKAELPHGKFTDFIKDNFSFSPRYAQNYIQFYERKAELLLAAENSDKKMSLSQALKLLQKPKETPVAAPIAEPEVSIEVTFTRAENVLLKELLDNGINDKKAHQLVFNRALKRTEKQQQKLLPAKAPAAADVLKARKMKSVERSVLALAELNPEDAYKLLKQLEKRVKAHQQ